MFPLDIDPFTRENLLTPYPFQNRLREAGPVVWLSRYNVYATGRFHLAKQILQDPVRFISACGVGLVNTSAPRTKPGDEPAAPALHRQRNPLIEADPPQHTCARRLVDHLLGTTRVKQVAQQASLHAHQLLDRLGQQPFDAVHDFATALALHSYPTAIGLLTQERTPLVALGELAMNSLGPHNALFMHSAASARPHLDWLHRNTLEQSLAESSIGTQLYAAAAAHLSQEDAQDLLATLLISGVDTTLAALTSTLYHLATHPGQWQLLQERPSLAARACEEAVRLEAPIQMCYRTVALDTQLEGLALQAGSKIMVHLGAASRDPAEWPKPDSFDVLRERREGLTFGHGIHHCPGKAMALAQCKAVVSALLQRVQRIELVQPATFALNNTLRRPESLLVRVVAR